LTRTRFRHPPEAEVVIRDEATRRVLLAVICRPALEHTGRFENALAACATLEVDASCADGFDCGFALEAALDPLLRELDIIGAAARRLRQAPLGTVVSVDRSRLLEALADCVWEIQLCEEDLECAEGTGERGECAGLDEYKVAAFRLLDEVIEAGA
jgi:hypothetical protein